MHDQDQAMLGGKAWNLARLADRGFKVPAWFVVPADVFVATLARNKLDRIVQDTLSDVSWESAAAVRRAAEGLADLVRRVRPAAEARDAIVAGYRDLGGGLVAVRSSAIGEDSAAASFAGQHDSFLFVKGADAVLGSVASCWASAFSERALFYRHRNGLPTGDIRIAVVIQEMVFGEVSGVLFTANPVANDEDQAVLSATYGLGEGLVSGELDADSWVVDRATRKVLSAEIASKTRCIVFDTERGYGTARAEVREESREVPCLDDADIARLVDTGERVATEFKAPQDIEWTLRDGEIFLLQSRPITTLKPKPRGTRRLWDNSNIAESYHGVTTPLTFSFVNRMYEVAYQVMFDAFGIPQRVLRDHQEVFANLLGLLGGRIFYNLSNYYKIITFLPAYEYMKDFFDTMIGVQERTDYQRRPRNWLKTLFVGVPRILYLAGRIYGNFLIWDREVSTFNARFSGIFEHYRRLDYAAMSPDEILSTYRVLEKELLWGWRAPMTNDFFAMVFFGLAKKFVAKWGIDAGGSLHNDLLCGEGGLDSTEPAKELIRLAVAMRQEPELVALFEATPESELPGKLAEPDTSERFAAFRERLGDYLDRYGFRCMGELKLEVKNLVEDPTFVYAMLKNYLRQEKLDLAEIASREREIRERAEETVRQALAGRALHRLAFGWILRNARKGVRNRENLRMARTRAFGLVRQLFCGLGEQFCKLGVLDAADDVFYLDIADCFAWVEGRSTLTSLKGLVALRKGEFEAFRATPIGDRFETVGAVHYGDQLHGPPDGAPDDTAAVLQGTSCCPGQVSAPARVIVEPGDDMRLSGEILVTERTDPGWVPLYPSASGLLIERGSLLSHAAVVARELGLPAIIGIKGLTRRVRDGQVLRMDGRAGTVTLGEPV